MPTIALVDDDRNILTSVSLSLEAEGYRIQTYTDGASALEGLKANPPDLAIFDIQMPKMNGFELYRHAVSRRLNASGDTCSCNRGPAADRGLLQSRGSRCPLEHAS